MQLSVIIVNYNVRHFLEQCLCSVEKAIAELQAEVIVVDNHSTDNSLAYLQPLFPQVKFIANAENRGFGKACNQGLEQASGKYILFLNPDTIVPEDCFHQCIYFLEMNAGAGALGIHMTDGNGKFLKESKRSFPSPVTSLYKLAGLSRLFPRSATFSRYHLGHLDEQKTHEVDVLSGAFMLIKKEVLDKTGGFDEAFFMYGEDVDLSYRIQQAGYSNYYFAGSSIIHFKGESTRRDNTRYVKMFYQAMSVFVRKHYGGSRAGMFNFLIQSGILIRGMLAAIASFIRRIGLPLIDAGLILLSFWVMKGVWNNYVKTATRYENELLWIAFPLFSAVYLITAYYAGLYDRSYRRSELVTSTLTATLVILAGYALLPEQYRFSRGILLFGALLAFLLIALLRKILVRSGVLTSSKEKQEHARTLIAGNNEEYAAVLQLMNEAGLQETVLGRVSTSEEDATGIGYWSSLDSLQQDVPFKEVIFCSGSIGFKNIISYLPRLQHRVKIKIHASGSNSIVGSDSGKSTGESVATENGFKLADPYNRRLKRLLDIGIALTGIVSFPVQLLLVKKPFRFLGNCFAILLAQKTWIGYALPEKNLPGIRKAVIACNGIPIAVKQVLPQQSLQMLDYWYARDYDPVADARLISKTWNRLGGA